MWILFWQVLLLLLGKDPTDQWATNDEREEGVWGMPNKTVVLFDYQTTAARRRLKARNTSFRRQKQPGQLQVFFTNTVTKVPIQAQLTEVTIAYHFQWAAFWEQLTSLLLL
jgi:hypothetical protein